MIIITEDYVSFEVARLLKEKGFLKGVDLRTTQNLSFYDNIGLTHNLNKYYDTLIQDKIDFVVAPTFQMAMKWLRKVHNIVIEIRVNHHFRIFDGYSAAFVKIDGDVSFDYYLLNNKRTYEETVEAAIKYCLENLI